MFGGSGEDARLVAGGQTIQGQTPYFRKAMDSLTERMQSSKRGSLISRGDLVASGYVRQVTGQELTADHYVASWFFGRPAEPWEDDMRFREWAAETFGGQGAAGSSGSGGTT